MIWDSMIFGLEEDEAINEIVRDRVGRVIVSSQSKFLSGKLNIYIIIIAIAIFIVVVIIIVIFFYVEPSYREYRQ